MDRVGKVGHDKLKKLEFHGPRPATEAVFHALFQQDFDAQGSQPERSIDRDEADAVRAVHAVPYVSVLAQLTGAEIIELADTYEGWAQDPSVGAQQAFRLLGWADQYRLLAEIAGAAWQPYPPRGNGAEGVRMLQFVALMNRMPR